MHGRFRFRFANGKGLRFIGIAVPIVLRLPQQLQHRDDGSDGVTVGGLKYDAPLRRRIAHRGDYLAQGPLGSSGRTTGCATDSTARTASR
jgi:hypothetical protein